MTTMSPRTPTIQKSPIRSTRPSQGERSLPLPRGAGRGGAAVVPGTENAEGSLTGTMASSLGAGCRLPSWLPSPKGGAGDPAHDVVYGAFVTP
jgi:hypothetical protein